MKRLKTKLISLRWRQTSMRKWAHAKFGNRRFTLRKAMLLSQLIAEPKAVAKPGVTPASEAALMARKPQKFHEQDCTSLRQMKVRKVA
jgi:hypothetical protein